MDGELLAIARKLAERGWLPGVTAAPDGMPLRLGHFLSVFATEADIHLSCHNAIVDPKRQWHLRYVHNESGGFTEVHYGHHETHRARSPGHTTLSLLRAYAAALEASK